MKRYRVVKFGCLTVLVLIVGVIGYITWEMRAIDPPPIVAKALTKSRNDWQKKSETFTSLLLQRYPIGSSAKKLETELTAQGFVRDRVFDLTKCHPDGGTSAEGKPYKTCPGWDPHWDPHNELQATWRPRFEVVCGHIAFVTWSADTGGRITHLDGTIENPCL